MFEFRLKCVQLDLARQMETMAYLKSFFDFASEAGYNAVLLYLEDRIRTESYHLQPEGEAYFPEEIRELAAYAQGKKLELIPCVATLGHAERFLAHPELEALSEVRGKMKNRFGYDSGKNVFCITSPDFYPFMETYLQEVAALFPSSLFHAGLDEFFNFNLCVRCRKAMPEFADEERAFLHHIIRIRDCLGKAGKRMMMWSDMFEIYTHVLPEIPKDVVVVDWQYQEDVRFYLGHLFEQGVEDRIGRNNVLGLATVMASAERDLGNTESAIEYARNRGILDFLVTSWEKSDTFLYRSFPILFYAGLLLNGVEKQAAWERMMQSLFGSSEMLLSGAVRLAVSSGNLRHFEEISDTALFVRPFCGLPKNAFTRTRTIQEMLSSAKNMIRKPSGLTVWKDLWNMLEEKRIALELKTAFWDVFDFGFRPEFRDRAVRAEADFLRLLESKSEDWKIHRTGIPGNIFEGKKAGLAGKLRKAIESLAGSSFLCVRFCMPDQYVVNHYSVDLKIGGRWEPLVVKNAGKADLLTDALFEHVTCFECHGVPQAVRIRTAGMGGRGIAYISVRTSSGVRYVPESVLEYSGTVEHPEYLLENDSKFAWFHAQTTRLHYLSPQEAAAEHSVTLALRQEL